MANGNRVSYQYIGGSVAEKLDWTPFPNSAAQKQPRSTTPRQTVRPKAQAISIDLVTVVGLVMPILMVAMMLAAGLRFYSGLQERNAAQEQVQVLLQEQAQLRDTFEAGYDLEEVRQAALDMGMIPLEEAKTIPIEVPAAPQELTFWQWIGEFFAGLFA